MDARLYELYQMINTPSTETLAFIEVKKFIEDTALGDEPGILEGFQKRDWRYLDAILSAAHRSRELALGNLAIRLMNDESVRDEIVRCGIIMAACRIIRPSLSLWLQEAPELGN